MGPKEKETPPLQIGMSCGMSLLFNLFENSRLHAVHEVGSFFLSVLPGLDLPPPPCGWGVGGRLCSLLSILRESWKINRCLPDGSSSFPLLSYVILPEDQHSLFARVLRQGAPTKRLQLNAKHSRKRSIQKGVVSNLPPPPPLRCPHILNLKEDQMFI